MNGIHDMGGMHGHGAIEREADEPVFHAAWEARMFGLRRALMPPLGLNIDRFRYLRETMPPAVYLSWSYYEHWYFVCATALLEAGMIAPEELRTGHPATARDRRGVAMPAADVDDTIRNGGVFTRPAAAAPRFSVGQAVTARTMNPVGHTRLPRYARGRRGEIQQCHGAHVFPDRNAMGDGECPQHLYTVAFTARELWGPEADGDDKIHLDLWESYLEPA